MLSDEQSSPRPPLPRPRLCLAVPPAGGARSDAALVQAIVEGDASVAGQLYDRLRPSIEHALRRVLHGRSAELDDLVQTAFEHLIRTIGQGRFEGRCTLATFASAIAAHVALDSLRRRGREQRVFVEQDPNADDPGVTPVVLERQLEARAEVRRVHGVLGRMKPELAHVLLLHDLLGYAVVEIAEHGGLTVSGVQSRLGRARKEFARRFGASVAGVDAPLPETDEWAELRG